VRFKDKKSCRFSGSAFVASSPIPGVSMFHSSVRVCPVDWLIIFDLMVLLGRPVCLGEMSPARAVAMLMSVIFFRG
jgi:hypothetical protein